jgi:hypothetical protein
VILAWNQSGDDNQERMVEFGDWLCMDVVKKIPSGILSLNIPKILCRYFLYDRRLLADLSRSAWESLKVFLQDAVPENNPLPGAVIAAQTFGDLPGFNTHSHILVTDGFFYGNKGMFLGRPAPGAEKAGGHFPAQNIQDAPEQGKYHEGDDSHALHMAALWVQRLLRQLQHIARR